MTRIFAAIAMLAAATLGAQADEPIRWDGFYIGAHAGHGWGKWNGPLSYDDHNPKWPQPQFAFDDASKTIEGSGWLGGLQIGYNYQTGRWVYGIEADVSWTDMAGAGSFLPYPNNPGSPAWEIETRLSMFGTARGRVGFTSGPMLIYATGGLAWANVESSIQPVYDGGFVAANGRHEIGHIGYAVGGGMEWLLSRHWSIKAEYLFLDLGEKNYSYAGKTVWGTAYDTDHYHADLEMHLVRLGINYKF